MDKKSILIVEDEKNTREFLCKVVASDDSLVLSAAVASLKEARQFLSLGIYPDLMLVDLGLPDGDGVELIREVRASDSVSAMMVLSIFGDEGNVVNAIEAGAGGYIHKDEPLHEISAHIQSILSGCSPISPSIAKHILNRMHANLPAHSSVQHTQERVLTVREVAVLDMLSRGFSRVESAGHLDISPHTMTSHIKNIYRKLEVHSRTEAVFEATQRGLL